MIRTIKDNVGRVWYVSRTDIWDEEGIAIPTQKIIDTENDRIIKEYTQRKRLKNAKEAYELAPWE